MGISTDRRFATGSTLQSRYLSEAVNARPLERLQLTAEYRLSRYDARQRNVPSSRQNLNLRGQLRLSQNIALQGEATRSREAEREYASWDAMFGWLPTPKLSLSAGASSERSDRGPQSLLLTLQSLYPRHAPLGHVGELLLF